MSTKCNCVDKVNAALREHFGSDASLDLDLVKVPGGSDARSRAVASITAGYSYTKVGRRVSGRLAIKHCPFCGVKLEVA